MGNVKLWLKNQDFHTIAQKKILQLLLFHKCYKPIIWCRLLFQPEFPKNFVVLCKILTGEVENTQNKYNESPRLQHSQSEFSDGSRILQEFLQAFWLQKLKTHKINTIRTLEYNIPNRNFQTFFKNPVGKADDFIYIYLDLRNLHNKNRDHCYQMCTS